MTRKQTPSNQEKEFALRRVVYDVLIAVKSLVEIPQVRRDFSKKESLKISALIMVRNLNAFLYHTDYGHCDDIHSGDFGLTCWAPAANAALGKRLKERINKLVGHVVTSRPDPFKDDQEVSDVALPLIHESCEFIRHCRKVGGVGYRGAAKGYVLQLNSLLPMLGFTVIPEN